MKLLTIGYEGLSTKEFFQILLVNKVKTLVDVRQLPLSRKPGFSKSSLRANAEKVAIQYIHVHELGCPREIRYDYRIDEDWKRYTRRFMSYLKTQDAAIENLTVRALSERCCLMCFEANPNFCHRSYVAARMANGYGDMLEIEHLRSIAPSRVAAREVVQSSVKAGKPSQQ